MRGARRHWRKALAFSIVCTGGYCGFGLQGRAEAPADADVFLIGGTLNLDNTMSANLGTVGYTMGTDVQCTPTSLVVTGAPGFVDATGGQSGECTGVTGSGSLTVVECSTGLVTGTWQMPEPGGGSTANFSGEGVVVGGVALIAAPPAAGFGYTDESAPGGAVAVATIFPRSNESCGSNTHMVLTAAVAGVY